MTKTTLKKNKVAELKLPDLKFYKATIIKTGWHWCKKTGRKINETENQEIKPYICRQMISDKAQRPLGKEKGQSF